MMITVLLFWALLHYQHQYNLWVLGGIVASITCVLCLVSYGSPVSRLLSASPIEYGVGVATGLGLSLATHAAFAIAEGVWPQIAAGVAPLYAQLQVWPGVVIALPVLILLVVTEELIWRGLLYDLLTTKVRPFIAIFLGTIAFPIPHVLTGQWSLGLAALLLGGCCMLLRHYRKNIVVPILTHLIWNLCIMVIFPVG